MSLTTKKIKALEMLFSLSHCPAGEIHGYEFTNGMIRPNNQPPCVVCFTHEDKIWRRNKYEKRWTSSTGESLRIEGDFSPLNDQSDRQYEI